MLFSQPKTSSAAPDFHSFITIFHDEVIEIFAFSSARGLNFTLYYSAYFVVFYISQHFKKNQVPPRQNPGAATDKYSYKFKIVLVKKEVDQIEFFKIRYSTRMCESRSWPTRIASKDISNSFVFFKAPGS